MNFKVYKTRNKQWAWRLLAFNNEIIAQGESYKRRKDCFDAINLVKSVNEGTPVNFPNKAE